MGWEDEDGLGRGRGENITHNHGHTRRQSGFLSLSGQPEPRAGGLAAQGRRPPPAQAPGPQCRNFHMAYPPHMRWTAVPSGGEAMPFCFLSKGEPPGQRLAVSAPPWDTSPEPPTTVSAAGSGHAEGTILPHFLGKVTSEAGTGTSAALGAAAHSQDGVVSRPWNSGPANSGCLRQELRTQPQLG